MTQLELTQVAVQVTVQVTVQVALQWKQSEACLQASQLVLVLGAGDEAQHGAQDVALNDLQAGQAVVAPQQPCQQPHMAFTGLG